MQSSGEGGFLLDIAQNVLQDDGFVALSDAPWLRLPPSAFPRGAIVEMRYAASLYDAPERPLLRFWRADRSFTEQILPAPTEGAGLWVGRTPNDFVEVWISPTNRTGRFGFRIESIAPVSLAHVLRRALRSPKRLFFAVAAGLLGLRAEADLNWRFVLGAEPLANYPAWRAARRRDADPMLDRPRGEWRAVICVTIDARGATAEAVDATRRSVEAQSYPHCRLALADVGGAPTVGAAEYILPLRAGDRLEPHACACFVEFFARAPEKDIAFADEIDASGLPLFKPCWSPTLHAFQSCVGRGVCFRASLLDDVEGWRSANPEELVRRLLARIAANRVGVLRRPLIHLGAPVEPPPRPSIDAACRNDAARVTIIVPTRDRVDLLAPCLDSILKKTTHGRIDILVIDNDSADPRTHALLARLQQAGAPVKKLAQPGAFNFSALCNAGAENATGDYLLFLNNDTQVISPDWIERLLYFAKQQVVGAVGAKLLYPSGATQHAGIVLGMGGVAGHFGAGLGDEAAGWADRNQLPHDVSAVTGACLMVAREKFAAVGGFDAAQLPVEFSDIDLCLRLSAKGWRTVCNTQAKLVHHEAASRSAGLLKLQWVYQKERRVFVERWRAVIRDDPYFHPGMSLYRPEPALP